MRSCKKLLNLCSWNIENIQTTMNEMTEGIGGCLVIITFKKNIFQGTPSMNICE